MFLVFAKARFLLFLSVLSGVLVTFYIGQPDSLSGYAFRWDPDKYCTTHKAHKDCSAIVSYSLVSSQVSIVV